MISRYRIISHSPGKSSSRSVIPSQTKNRNQLVLMRFQLNTCLLSSVRTSPERRTRWDTYTKLGVRGQGGFWGVTLQTPHLVRYKNNEENRHQDPQSQKHLLDIERRPKSMVSLFSSISLLEDVIPIRIW